MEERVRLHRVSKKELLRALSTHKEIMGNPMLVYPSPKIRKEIERAAAQHGVTISTIINDCFEFYLREIGKD